MTYFVRLMYVDREAPVMDWTSGVA